MNFDILIDLILCFFLIIGVLLLDLKTFFRFGIEMVYFHSSIAACKSTETPAMSGSIGSADASLKQRRINHLQKNKRAINPPIHPSCSQSRSAAIDILIVIAVIGAFGFLLYPYVRFTYVKAREIGELVMSVLIEEIIENPVIYASLGISMVCVTAAAWAIVICTSRKCGNPSCRGLKKAAEFDIQIETEECVKNSDSLVKKRGLFELPRDHHRELEAELKKMAPPNGRAVLVFKARCGCSVGRMEVPGSRKPQRIKK